MIFTAIASGFKFLEAGRVDERGRVYFSDYARGGVHRLDGATLDSWLPQVQGIGGMAFNDDGRLLLSGGDGLWLFDPASGERRPLLLEVEGKRRGFNDVEPDGAGGLYAATIDLEAGPAGRPPRYGELIHLAADGAVTILRRGIGAANGIGIAPDGGTLYLSDTGTGIWRHALTARTAVADATLIHAAPDTDGLEVDAAGNIWTACWQSGQVTRIAARDGAVSTFPLPQGQAMTLAFGGPDLRDLYVFGGADITNADGPAVASLYRARVEVAGQAQGRTSFR